MSDRMPETAEEWKTAYYAQCDFTKNVCAVLDESKQALLITTEAAYELRTWALKAVEALSALKHEFERMSNARDWPSYLKAEDVLASLPPSIGGKK